MSRTSVKQSFAAWVPRVIGLASVAAAIGVAGGCSSDTAPGSLSKICKLNSDCTGDLVCSFGLCHAECEKLKDCPANQLCVSARGGEAGTQAGVCQLQQETHCAHNSECDAPLVCAVDLQCRNQCLDRRDCISGEVCAFGVCASPDEVGADGKLKNAVSGSTAPGSGAGGADNDGGTGGRSGTGGNSSGGAGGGGNGGASGATHGGAGGSSTTETDSGAGDHDASTGSGGEDSGAPPSSGDPCSPEKTTNDDHDHATPYVLGTEFKGCLQTSADVDYYSYTVPATPAQGGVIVVSLTDVGAMGGLNMTTQAVADNGDVVNAYGLSGGSVFHWFGARAGASFRVKVSYFTSNPNPTPYTLEVKYTGVNDVNEPNDTRAMAKEITNGTPVQGYLFAGFENSTSVPAAAWQDWFKVTLPAGMATISLMDLASDINGDVTLFDSLGSQISDKYSPTAGASVVLNQTVTAGDYYVRLQPFTAPNPRGTGSTVPEYTRQPYTLATSVK